MLLRGARLQGRDHVPWRTVVCPWIAPFDRQTFGPLRDSGHFLGHNLHSRCLFLCAHHASLLMYCFTDTFWRIFTSILLRRR